MLNWVIGFVLLDIVVTLAVVTFVMRRREAGGIVIAGLSIPALRAFTDAIHPRIGDYVRANWSGAPEQLPPILETLLSEMESEARKQGLELDRDTLKKALRLSLASHRVAPGKSIDEALAHVA